MLMHHVSSIMESFGCINFASQNVRPQVEIDSQSLALFKNVESQSQRACLFGECSI